MDGIPNLDAFSENVFGDLLNSNRDFFQVINDLLTQRVTHKNLTDAAGRQNAYIKGMAIVIKAFDYMQEFDLLPRFASLQSNDIALAKQTLDASFPKQEEHTITILQRLLKLPRIPEQQINLNECIAKAAESSLVNKREITTGAAAMYKTLEALWPKLYPPQTPPPPSA